MWYVSFVGRAGGAAARRIGMARISDASAARRPLEGMRNGGPQMRQGAGEKEEGAGHHHDAARGFGPRLGAVERLGNRGDRLAREMPAGGGSQELGGGGGALAL